MISVFNIQFNSLNKYECLDVTGTVPRAKEAMMRTAERVLVFM